MSRNQIGGGWSTADITISTTADQTPIAPGRRVSDLVENGRRTARFASDAPILTFFSIQSARYAEKHRQHAGVDLAVYYHPDHHWNVDRMLDALGADLRDTAVAGVLVGVAVVLAAALLGLLVRGGRALRRTVAG